MLAMASLVAEHCFARYRELASANGFDAVPVSLESLIMIRNGLLVEPEDVADDENGTIGV
jgi:hypothetical protein